MDYTAAEYLKTTIVTHVTEHMGSGSLVVIKGAEINSIDATVAAVSNQTPKQTIGKTNDFRFCCTDYCFTTRRSQTTAVRSHLLELECGSCRRCLPSAKEVAQHVQVHKKLYGINRNDSTWREWEGERKQTRFSYCLRLKSTIKCRLFCTVRFIVKEECFGQECSNRRDPVPTS